MFEAVSTTFGGLRLPPTNNASPFGGYRAVTLDSIPIGLVGAITVTKSNLPSQDAEALGGTIDGQGPGGRPAAVEGDSGLPGRSGNRGPMASVLAILGLRGPTFPGFSLGLTLVSTTGAVAAAMAFGLFGRRRRDGEAPDSDAVLAAAAATGIAIASPDLRSLPQSRPRVDDQLIARGKRHGGDESLAAGGNVRGGNTNQFIAFAAGELRQIAQGKYQQSALAGEQCDVVQRHIANEVGHDHTDAFRAQHRFAIPILRGEFREGHNEAIAGAGREHHTLLTIAHQHTGELRAGRRIHTPGQRLTLAAR